MMIKENKYDFNSITEKYKQHKRLVNLPYSNYDSIPKQHYPLLYPLHACHITTCPPSIPSTHHSRPNPEPKTKICPESSIQKFPGKLPPLTEILYLLCGTEVF